MRAQVRALNQTTLAAEIAGVIEALPVNEGASFARGAVLARFDCEMYVAQLDRASAMMDGTVKKLEAYQRLRELNSVGQLELDMADADMRRAKAELAQQRAMVARCEIRAPFAGKLVNRKVQERQFVQPGAPLLEIIDDRRLEVVFIADSKSFTAVAPGARFSLTVDENGQTYDGVVSRRGAKIDPVSQTIEVYGRLRDTAGLLPGMTGDVTILR
jgi:RND family efflux transporter MFP subunit